MLLHCIAFVALHCIDALLPSINVLSRQSVCVDDVEYVNMVVVECETTHCFISKTFLKKHLGVIARYLKDLEGALV